MLLDLRSEDRRMALCLLECLYMGGYSGLEDYELPGPNEATKLGIGKLFHHRIRRFRVRHSFPGLQAYAWSQVLQCQWELDNTLHNGP